MTRANLSKRAAQLLGPPPDHPIDWDALVLHEPCEIKSAPVVPRAPSSPESPEWVIPTRTRKRRRKLLPAPRRVTLSPEESGSSPITTSCEQTKKRRLEKRKRRRGLKQSTIAQSLKLHTESSTV